VVHRTEGATLTEGRREAARRTSSERLDDEPHRQRPSSSPANGTGNPHGSGSAHLGI